MITFVCLGDGESRICDCAIVEVGFGLMVFTVRVLDALLCCAGLDWIGLDCWGRGA